MSETQDWIEPEDAAAQLGGGRVFTTVERSRFYDQLRRGDVVLFSSLDDLGVLGESIERRPVYHSSIYLGKYPDCSASGSERHVVLHNVSYLWWSDNTRHRPQRHQGEVLTSGAADYWIPRAHAELFPPSDGTSGPEALADARADALVALSSRGGIGPTFIDAYLDSDVEEKLWHHLEPWWTDPAPARTQRVRKIRMAVALRHESLLGAPTEEAGTPFDAALIGLAKDWNATGESGGFPAAELAAMVPTLSQRPGFASIVPGQVPPSLGIAMLHHNPTAGEKAICAMYCAKVYEKAGLPLTLDAVPIYYDPTRRYHTPRDLWDCPELHPIAMLVVPPDRGTRFSPPLSLNPPLR
ncbi:MAG: hypothetical protein ACE367_18585 [Acidimicrobiales bacterium]